MSLEDSTFNILAMEEYKEIVNNTISQFTDQWSKPKYQCPICNGEMCKNLNIALLTYPAQYAYRCNRCGYIGYQYI